MTRKVPRTRATDKRTLNGRETKHDLFSCSLLADSPSRVGSFEQSVSSFMSISSTSASTPHRCEQDHRMLRRWASEICMYAYSCSEQVHTSECIHAMQTYLPHPQNISFRLHVEAMVRRWRSRNTLLTCHANSRSSRPLTKVEWLASSK